MKKDSADCTWPNAEAVWVITPRVIAPAKKRGAVTTIGEDDRELGVARLVEGELRLVNSTLPAVAEDVGEAR